MEQVGRFFQKRPLYLAILVLLGVLALPVAVWRDLAARMEGIAEPGGIVMSYETYSLVQDLIEAEPMPPARFKGVAREITPYRVNAAKQPIERAAIQQAADGSRVTVALDNLDEAKKQRVLAALQDVLAPQQRQGG